MHKVMRKSDNVFGRTQVSSDTLRRLLVCVRKCTGSFVGSHCGNESRSHRVLNIIILTETALMGIDGADIPRLDNSTPNLVSATAA